MGFNRQLRELKYITFLVVLGLAQAGGACAATAKVTAAASHGLSLNATGVACGAGENAYGVLGDGTAVDRWTPVPVVNLYGTIGCTPAECDSFVGLDFWLFSYGYISRKIRHDCFCSSQCPVPGPPTRHRVSRCQTHAPRVPVRTHHQVQQAGLRLCSGPRGSPRPLLQPHAFRGRQDALALPDAGTG